MLEAVLQFFASLSQISVRFEAFSCSLSSGGQSGRISYDREAIVLVPVTSVVAMEEVTFTASLLNRLSPSNAIRIDRNRLRYRGMAIVISRSIRFVIQKEETKKTESTKGE